MRTSAEHDKEGYRTSSTGPFPLGGSTEPFRNLFSPALDPAEWSCWMPCQVNTDVLQDCESYRGVKGTEVQSKTQCCPSIAVCYARTLPQKANCLLIGIMHLKEHITNRSLAIYGALEYTQDPRAWQHTSLLNIRWPDPVP